MTLQFLYPYFLIALVSILIPIIIHLNNFRLRKIVFFSDVNLLSTLKIEHKSKRQIKNWWILFSRILAIAFLVFSFSQPYLTENKENINNTSNTVAIYIDNSFSMQNENNEGLLLNTAKNRALDIINNLNRDTRYFLQTNDFEGKHQYPLSKKQVTQYISQIHISPNRKSIAEVITRLVDLNTVHITNENPLKIFLLSDFQKSSSKVERMEEITSAKFFFIPIQPHKTNNLYIDSIWFDTPHRRKNVTEVLNIKLVNHSAHHLQNIPVEIEINKQKVNVKSIDIAPQESKVVSINYTVKFDGIINGLVKVNDYPITYDNTFYFNYTIKDKINVLILNEFKENSYLNAVFNYDDNFHLENKKVANLEKLENIDMVILNETKNLHTGLLNNLEEFIERGGSVIFSPSLETMEANNKLLTYFKIARFTKLDSSKKNISPQIDLQDENFKNVFKNYDNTNVLPTIYSSFILKLEPLTATKILLKSNDENTIFSVSNIGRGKLYILSTPLNEKSNNIVQHPIILPMIYNPSINSRSTSTIYYTVGKDIFIDVEKEFHNYLTLKVSTLKDNYSFMGTISREGHKRKLDVDNYIKQAGNFLISNEKIKQTGGVAFNYSRKESTSEFYNENDLKKYDNITVLNNTKSKNFQQNLSYLNNGIPLWKYLIIISLLFFLIEIVLLRKSFFNIKREVLQKPL